MLKGPVVITGGIASGKSTVLRELASLGWRTGSADRVAAEVFARPEIQTELGRLGGLPVPIDRVALRHRMSQDATVRIAVNALMHATVAAELRARDDDAVEVPLLFEACWVTFGRSVWAVVCAETTQLERLTSRLGDAAEAARWIDAQLPMRVKARLADRVVDADASPVAMAEQVRAFARIDARMG